MVLSQYTVSGVKKRRRVGAALMGTGRFLSQLRTETLRDEDSERLDGRMPVSPTSPSAARNVNEFGATSLLTCPVCNEKDKTHSGGDPEPEEASGLPSSTTFLFIAVERYANDEETSGASICWPAGWFKASFSTVATARCNPDGIGAETMVDGVLCADQPTTAPLVFGDSTEPMLTDAELMASADSAADKISRISGAGFKAGSQPKLLCSMVEEFRSDRVGDGNNFLKGCKWSPDGSCLLTSSEDRVLRVFTLPPSFYVACDCRQVSYLPVFSRTFCNELIYDFAWHPLMRSSKASTCTFAYCSRDHPVQLCDAASGLSKATYQPINHMDELARTHGIAFSLDGSKLLAGTNKMVRVFDVARPGRQTENRPTWLKHDGGQCGIISCFAFSSLCSTMYCCGSYGGSVGLYDLNSRAPPLFVFDAHRGGVTDLAFSKDGTLLFTGGRKDCVLFCWDVRYMPKALCYLPRTAATSQRISFALDSSGTYLVSGSSTGRVAVWDVRAIPQQQNSEQELTVFEPNLMFTCGRSAVNGVSVHPSLPLLATSSGERVFPSPLHSTLHEEDLEDGSIGDEADYLHTVDTRRFENCLKLWLTSE